eukprot:6183998-Pleurochrysis_carterae.AAC.2
MTRGRFPPIAATRTGQVDALESLVALKTLSQRSAPLDSNSGAPCIQAARSTNDRLRRCKAFCNAVQAQSHHTSSRPRT